MPGKTKPRKPPPKLQRLQHHLAALRQDIQRLQLQVNRQQVVANKTDDAIAERTNPAEYELGQDLLSLGHTVLLLRKILQQIQEQDIVEATTTIQEALTYYQLAHEHSWTIAKDTWKALTAEQRLAGPSPETNAMLKLRSEMAKLQSPSRASFGGARGRGRPRRGRHRGRGRRSALAAQGQEH